MGLTRVRAEQISDIDYKQATRVVTVSDITLAGSAPALVDGVTLLRGNRVLVTGQTTASQNGLYEVQTVGTGANGTWIRTSDANATGEVEAGMIVMVTEGTVYADTQWKLITDDPIVIGVTELIFTQNYSTSSLVNGTSNVVVANNANVTVGVSGNAAATIGAGFVSVQGLMSTVKVIDTNVNMAPGMNGMLFGTTVIGDTANVFIPDSTTVYVYTP
jgi:phage-related tail fiber protein